MCMSHFVVLHWPDESICESRPRCEHHLGRTATVERKKEQLVLVSHRNGILHPLVQQKCFALWRDGIKNGSEMLYSHKALDASGQLEVAVR